MGLRKYSFFGLMSLAVLAWVSCPSSARADTLTLDADNGDRMSVTFNGSSPFDAAVLSGDVSPTIPVDQYLYCVDLNTSIIAGTIHFDTTVNTLGTVDSLGGAVPNGDEVSWLVNHITPLNDDQALGLQALIWRAEYGLLFDLVSGHAATTALYAAYVSGVDSSLYSAPVGNAFWISPPGDFGPDQGLVAPNGTPVPEPSSLILTLIGVLVANALAPKVRVLAAHGIV